MSASHFAAVLRVVRKALCRHGPVLIADQPVALYPLRIEFHLKLHVLRHRKQGAPRLTDQDLPCLSDAVDIAVIAVPVIRHGFHPGVRKIALAEAQHRQEDAALCLFRDQPHEGSLIRHTDVQISVRCQDHPVVAAFHKILLGQLISLDETRRAVGAAGGGKIFHRVADHGLFRPVDTLQYHSILISIGDKRNPVLCPKLLRQQPEGPLHKRKLVVIAHGTGHINQEDQIGGRPLLLGDLLRLKAYHQKLRLLIPGAGSNPEGSGEGLSLLGVRIIIAEVIDHLLDPHRVRRHLTACQHHPPQIGVRGRVHIRREGGKRRAKHAAPGIFRRIGIFLRVPVRLRVSRLIVASRKCLDNGARLIIAVRLIGVAVSAHACVKHLKHREGI